MISETKIKDALPEPQFDIDGKYNIDKVVLYDDRLRSNIVLNEFTAIFSITIEIDFFKKINFFFLDICGYSLSVLEEYFGLLQQCWDFYKIGNSDVQIHDYI